MASSDAEEATYEPGDVVKLWYQSNAIETDRRACSYALYHGRGRVIHVWSSSRTHFRVRIDSLRVLEAAGVVAANITEQFDAYCVDVLGVQPLPGDEIVPRAMNALHASLRSQSLTLPLIIWARYGDIALTMAKSMFRILPTIATLVGIVAPAAVASDSVMATLTSQQRHEQASYSSQAEDSDETDQEDAGSNVGVEFAVECEEAIAQLTDINSLFDSGIGTLMAEWIRCTFIATETTGRDPRRTFGMITSLPDEPQAILLFNRLEKFFCVFFKSDGKVIDRLVRERMECGICFSDLSDMKIKVLECFHVLCEDCLGSLSPQICPYCRSSIHFVAQVTSEIKRMALTRIRENEILGLTANDVDAPVPSPTDQDFEATSCTMSKQEPVDLHGYDADVDDTDDSCSLDENADEGVELLAMQVEDIPVP